MRVGYSSSQSDGGTLLSTASIPPPSGAILTTEELAQPRMIAKARADGSQSGLRQAVSNVQLAHPRSAKA